MTTSIEAGPHPASEIDSSYAWMRLAVALLLGTIGSVGMWSFVVALPAVQADFGIARGEASLPFTLTMVGFGVGGIVMGRLADRFGIVRAGDARRGRARRRLCALGHRRQHRAVRAGAGPDRLFGSCGDLRAADDRHVALVRAPPRHRRGDRRRAATISRGAIWPPIIQHFIASRWLACHPDLDRHRLRRPDACRWSLLLRRRAPRSIPARLAADAAGKRGTLGISAECADGAAVHRRHRLLRRHVDAAGPYRRLLRRSRLRPGARRRDAVDDAGLRR